MHNIPLEKFATLTGRSISTFKRDFQAIFKETPNKWLIKKRLDLAHLMNFLWSRFSKTIGTSFNVPEPG